MSFSAEIVEGGVDVLIHAVDADNSVPNFRLHRNHYVATRENTICPALVEAGLMVRAGEMNEGRHVVYHATKAGVVVAIAAAEARRA